MVNNNIIEYESLIKDVKDKIYERQYETLKHINSQTWYFSIVDVVGVLTESVNPNNYWKVLKNRLIKEGNQSVTTCN